MESASNFHFSLPLLEYSIATLYSLIYHAFDTHADYAPARSFGIVLSSVVFHHLVKLLPSSNFCNSIM
ncbi:hypothetical protein P389DRAFT_110772 [Cystobasidium minutum MCA 4210]|uniref:uncharacterized protein n=1 Tax=Cystobasidium minutum MCA 4210 TaxID=1397322 RepID=UPI0034CD4E9A|eukprot:jgi/Rhomi1/110772/CE110771_98